MSSPVGNNTQTASVHRGPRVMFVMRTALGWKTYAAHVKNNVGASPDRGCRFLESQPTRFERLFVKHHNASTKAGLYRRLSPIQAMRGPSGREIRREIDQFAPDIIHFSGHFVAGAHAFRGSDIPFTVAMDATIPGMDRLLQHSVFNARDRREEAELLKRAAMIYPVSRWVEGSLMRDYGISQKRIRIIPFSIDMTRMAPPKEKAIDDRRPRVLFVGNDFLRKGGDKLYHWATGPLAGLCELHIVSRDTRAALSGENVVFHGSVENRELVDRLMPGMDLLCHPTQSDMSAIVVSEAARAGLPAVVSNVGGIGELVADGVTGYLLEKSDAEGFVDRLRTLITNPALRQQMGEAAYRFVSRTADARENYRLMYDELLSLARISCSGPRSDHTMAKAHRVRP